MIQLTELFHRVTILEQTEEDPDRISHLPHVVERAIKGKPEETIRHLRAAANFIQNKPSEGIIRQKADGRVSILFGTGFVQYKGKGKHNVPLSSQEEIESWVTKYKKPHLRDSLMMGLKAASHPDLPKGAIFQADTLLPHAPGMVKGNVIAYKTPNKKTKGMLAVHTMIKDGVVSPAPSLSHLSTDELHFPDLSVDHIMKSSSQEEIEKLNHHISEAERLFQSPEVSRVTKSIARHRDPTNKLGHRSDFFKKYNNAVQRGDPFTQQNRSLDNLMLFSSVRHANSNPAEKRRIEGHMRFIGARRGIQSNPLAINDMLTAHNHVDAARDIIVKVLHRANPGLKPIDPNTGKVNHQLGEGWVQTIPGIEPVKLVPTSFTQKNASENKDRNKKTTNEEMSVGAGGIAGIGGPEDVAVPVSAQKRYTKKGPKRRKIVEKFLNKFIKD